ncbi:hypothetical protein [Paludisphaera rhizosphaerae]|uniref:hypothetical protein n=1 Tax=Paludisphaera rhizosphaerae TaxID=2711216 RepID=UPI0013E9BDFC|nr:hypothetical protein [Paludisphaera rhizosphaerae]
MESRIWANIQERFADFVVLQGDVVHKLRVKGMVKGFLFKRKAQGVLEQLQQGAEPKEVGGTLETMPAGAIVKAEVSPGNGSLTLHSQDGAKLDFSTPNSDADVILAAILEKAGRSFSPAQEEIGAVEAALPPMFLGLIAGLFWAAVYDSASKLAAGEEIVVKGRRQGLQKLTIWVADLLGYNGVLAIGAVLGALLLGWLVMRLVKRPLRTVWLPATA